MNDELGIDERKVHEAVQRVIGTLISFDNDTRLRVLRTVSTFFNLDGVIASHSSRPAIHSHSSDPGEPNFSGRQELSPKEFLFQKQPKTDLERVACLAYYLAHYRGTPHFKTVDISKLNTEAAQVKFSNTAYAVANAANADFLAAAGKGAKQISAFGERYVEALPDRNAAKEIVSSMRRRRNRHRVRTKKPA